MAKNQVEYVVRVRGKHERVKLAGSCAVAQRFGQTISKFYPNAAQRKRIKVGRGKVRIMTKQVNDYRCRGGRR